MPDSISRLLEEGLSSHHEGALDRACERYREVLDLDPGNAQALHLLGVVALHRENCLEAIQLINESITRDDQVPEAHANLGLAYALQESYAEACAAFEIATTLKPRFAEAHNNLGLARQQLHDHKAAITAFRAAARLEPGLAIYHYNLGVALLQLQRDESALDHLSRAVALCPDHPDARYNLGVACHRLGQLSAAATSFKEALSGDPGHYAARCNLGTTLYDMGRFEDAAACYRDALAERPKDAETWLNLGQALYQQEHNEDATEAYRQAIELDPDNPQPYYLLGNLYRALGERPAAREYYDNAIALQPDHGPAFRARARLERFTEYNDDIRAMEQLLADPSVASEQKMHVGFALGKALEDLDLNGQALTHYLEANRQRRDQFEYDINSDRQRFAHWQRVFSANFFQRFDAAGYDDLTPVFIVGMPRSGTSLIEQILASHRDVHGAGELKLMNEIAERYLASENPAVYPENLLEIDSTLLTSCGEAYVKELRGRFGAAHRISDKMPGNFQHLGLIKLILPAATIIHCRRSPEDTCLSMFKNYFSADGLYYAYSLEELGEYYRLYDDLMAHWHRCLPGFIHDFQYEALVNDLDGQVKRLLNICGLDWDPACLSFHQTRRSVKTASASQVREPLYTSSVDTWQKFGAGLQPLLDKIRD